MECRTGGRLLRARIASAKTAQAIKGKTRDKTLGQLANEAERLQAIFERAAKSRQRSLNNRQLDNIACAKTAQAINGKAREDTAMAIDLPPNMVLVGRPWLTRQPVERRHQAA